MHSNLFSGLMKGNIKSAKKLPTFPTKEQLTRYVDKDDVKRGGRVSSAAFVPNPGSHYLSVNNVELESLPTIACYYRNRFQSGLGTVAIACRKVYKYNNAATHVGIPISYNRAAAKWEYSTHEGAKDAYRHREVTSRPKSYSHCGVEYINTTRNELTLDKFARRLAGKCLRLFPLKK